MSKNILDKSFPKKKNPHIDTHSRICEMNIHEPMSPKHIKKKQPVYFTFCDCHVYCHENNIQLKCQCK